MAVLDPVALVRMDARTSTFIRASVTHNSEKAHFKTIEKFEKKVPRLARPRYGSERGRLTRHRATDAPVVAENGR